jgi:hypothetical protein
VSGGVLSFIDREDVQRFSLTALIRLQSGANTERISVAVPTALASFIPSSGEEQKNVSTVSNDITSAVIRTKKP